jgi:predicted permease
MLKNYLKVAFRSLLRQKAFSGINILGLALGMTCSLFIWLWVQDELQVDAFHANGPQLYRVMERQLYDEGKAEALTVTPGLLAEELKKNFPEIIRASGFVQWDEILTFTVGEKINNEKGSYASSDWFQMFSFPLLHGNASTALNSPKNMVISRSIAEKYFGSSELAMGKTIRNGDSEYQVAGVFENVGGNSSIKFDFLLSWEEFLNRNKWATGWDNNGPSTFIQIRPDANAAQLEAKLKLFLTKYQKEGENHIFLLPYEQMYLYSNFTNGQSDGGRIDYVRLFSIVAVFILMIACINFMNLATARSMKRAKEVGIRKVVGAVRSLLIGQFMGEALLMTLIAVLLALIAVVLLLPAFNELTGKQIVIGIADPSFLMVVFGIILVTSLLAGSYPALFLSSFSPIVVLKGMLKFKPEVKLFRQGLVVVQFAFSTLLIVGTFIVYQQLNFIQDKNLGYNRGNLLYMPVEGEIAKKYETLKQELLRTPGIESVTRMTLAPTSIDNGTTYVEWPGKNPLSKTLFTTVEVGYDFLKTLDITILQGRDFSPAFRTDSTNFIINEKAALTMGIKEPVGKPLKLWGRSGKIIGLVKDFHFESLHVPIEPLVIALGENADWGNVLVRTQPGKTEEALSQVGQLVKGINPGLPFTYYFADEEYTKLYKSEQVVSKLANYFAFLGIFISCLGLFGLAAFTAEQRTREIGVRKVLGASVIQIITLLSGDFLKLVLLAFVIATPLSWYVMAEWLNNFAYQIEIEWWMFALAGLMAVGIALFTVSFQSVKAALANPIKSLRSE